MTLTQRWWAVLLGGTLVIVAAVTVLLVFLYKPTGPTPAEQDAAFLTMLEKRGTIPVGNPAAAVYYGRQVCANLDRGFSLPTSMMELAPLDSNWAAKSAVLNFCPGYTDAVLRLPT